MNENMRILNREGVDLYDYFAAQALSMHHMRTVPLDQKARKANDIADYMVAEKRYRFSKRAAKYHESSTKH
tara:strand:+ start:4111 stop:4323 length:213 start_codon:yes stop_codon:yes gene_type:complete